MFEKNKKLVNLYQRDFKSLFGVPLKDYFSLLLGFNIVAFDAQIIKTPEDEAMIDVVREKYGDVGVLLIEKLLG